MALVIKTIELSSGIKVNNVYARIEPFSGNKGVLSFVVNYYLDKQSADEGKTFILSAGFEMTTSVDEGSTNFIKQGYEYLKTLSDFEGAIDV
jgi:hypothetical protein